MIATYSKSHKYHNTLQPGTFDRICETYQNTIRKLCVAQAGPSKNEIRLRENKFSENSFWHIHIVLTIFVGGEQSLSRQANCRVHIPVKTFLSAGAKILIINGASIVQFLINAG